jgi:adenylyltransferase/sulfurtransferase
MPSGADAANLQAWLPRYDIVVDCTDNFGSKFRSTMQRSASASLPCLRAFTSTKASCRSTCRGPEWPCLRCLWPEAPRDGLVGNCAAAGVLGPVPAMLGAMQAMQCLKILLGLAPEAVPAVHMFDMLGMHWRTLKATRNPGCDHAALTAVAAAMPRNTRRSRTLVWNAGSGACLGPDAAGRA